MRSPYHVAGDGDRLKSTVMALNPDQIRAHLHEVRDGYFWWLSFCVWVVVAGVTLEGPEAWETLKKAFSKKDDSDHNRVIAAVAFLGWFLVVGGIVGEGIYESKVSQADGAIQTFERQETDATRKQADATRLETAKLNDRATRAELELFKLQQKQIARHLSDQQKKAIAQGLSEFAGQYARIEFQIYSPELNFVKELAGALGATGAKWNAYDSPSLEADKTLGIKVKVYRFATDRTIEAATALVKMLRRETHLLVTGPDVSELIPQEKRGPADYAPTMQMLITVGRHP
jgi:hypothetical protein